MTVLDCNFEIKYPLNCHYGDPLSVSPECLTIEIPKNKNHNIKMNSQLREKNAILLFIKSKKINKKKTLNVSVKMHGE